MIANIRGTISAGCLSVRVLSIMSFHQCKDFESGTERERRDLVTIPL